MAIAPPKNKNEAIFQYCNYGYDGTKFKDFNDCMLNYDKVFNTTENTKNFQNNVFNNKSNIFNKLPNESIGLNFNQGEPYIFLKDFSFIHSTTDGSIGSKMVNYKKGQVVYPFQSAPNIKMQFNPAFTKAINEKVLVPQKTTQQQALMLKQKADTNNRFTDRVFGKETNFVSGGGLRSLILPAYVVLGVIVGRYVAKSMKKSTTLGMVVGGVLPLVAYQLSLEYDRKKLPKQEPRQGVAYEPEIKPMAMAEEREMAIRFFKTLPDEFVFNNVRYFKNSNLEFYKQSFSSGGLIGATMPIKISGDEFNTAYIKFRNKDLPV